MISTEPDPIRVILLDLAVSLIRNLFAIRFKEWLTDILTLIVANLFHIKVKDIFKIQSSESSSSEDSLDSSDDESDESEPISVSSPSATLIIYMQLSALGIRLNTFESISSILLARSFAANWGFSFKRSELDLSWLQNLAVGKFILHN